MADCLSICECDCSKTQENQVLCGLDIAMLTLYQILGQREEVRMPSLHCAMTMLCTYTREEQLSVVIYIQHYNIISHRIRTVVTSPLPED
ncbi:hypothetical protein AVEN_95278-1 [Araneus ventricosus]|uniref:Uncharacterized protein n=1 Tax=Araneus ventricosus TaxID=182803 RepID=A0A4Y2DI03_ARAVE|nr:hypothetical protein AVEN_95278-1 [Araneus ventricosus]